MMRNKTKPSIVIEGIDGNQTKEVMHEDILQDVLSRFGLHGYTT